MDEKFMMEGTRAECGRYISYIYRKSCTEFLSCLKPESISQMQSVLLSGIYRYEGINQNTLAKKISVDTGAASRVLRELEDKGYIKKNRDEKNRKSFNLFLTSEGRKVAEESLAMQREYWLKLLQGFSEQEVETLNRLLLQMEQCAFKGTE